MSTDINFDDPVVDDEPTTILGFPLNRIVAFLGPYIATVSGAVASWLLVHVHVLGLFHLQSDGLTTGIAQGLTFLLVTVITWLGHSKWLQGHQAWESRVLDYKQAQLYQNIPEVPMDDPSIAAAGGEHPEGNDYDPSAFEPPVPPGS